MEKTLTSHEHLAEEDYIDMDLNSNSSSSSFICSASPPHLTEFEFQMSSNRTDTQTNTISPADELFYKGNLLPLHLPPRLQMVAKLLNNSPQPGDGASEEIGLKASIVRSSQKKSWSKKMNSIKQSSLGLKLKASRDYLKSIFFTSKLSGCSNQPHSMAEEFAGKATPPPPLTTSTSLFSSIEREKLMEDHESAHRKSFSGAINWTCPSTARVQSSTSTSSSCSSSASSSFSFARSNGGGAGQLQAMLKRSSSVNSEVESSIQGAIAYCKRSQQQMSCARRSVSETGSFALMSVHQIGAVCKSQDHRPGHCRG